MDAAGRVRATGRTAALMFSYGLASLVLIGLTPFLPVVWGRVDAVALLGGAAVCVGYGRRAVVPDRRGPWTLLVWSSVLFAAANLVRFIPGPRGAAVGGFVSAAGYVLLYAAGLAFIVRRGASDVGGVLDSAVIALAGGGVLWFVLPLQVGLEGRLVSQVEFFVALFALTGLFGALLRLVTTGGEADTALWWLLVATGLGISGEAVQSLAGSSASGHAIAVMLLLIATTAIGLFGLDPSGPRVVQPKVASTDRLSPARLAFLCLAVAFIPVAVGTRLLLAGEVAVGLLLVVPGEIAVLVIARIGFLSGQRDRAEKALQQQATHDPLTKLPNRRYFAERLRERLGRREGCALLFCDLDGFKGINDRLGHDAGDTLLVEVATRLQACVGPHDVVSRIGGDEFVVLLFNPTATQEKAIESRIVQAMRRPIERAGGVRIDISIGVAWADGQQDPEQLIRCADQAMYRVKEAHKGEQPTSHGNPSQWR